MAMSTATTTNMDKDTNTATDRDAGGQQIYTLSSLPKTWRFTQSLPADPKYSSPAISHQTPRDDIQPRLVRGALFSWVRPEEQEDPELLAVSPAALRDLGLQPSEAATEDFRQTAAGNRLWGWKAEAETEAETETETQAEAEEGKQKDTETGRGHGYPWAQCYGGFQFGQWAGQLGDGRAISLFEVPVGPFSSSSSPSSSPPTNPGLVPSYEIQLKGAGMTPYSRFADGRAVLRSSIREFVVSEALHALGIPSTRALALTRLPHVLVHRESLEPAAIVVRFAETWLRLGTFDLLRSRGDRALTRRLATYVAEQVFGSWDGQGPDGRDGRVEKDKKDEAAAKENRFAALFRQVVRRNAVTVARWQAYGFMNGVLNTDNTSIAGLSMDFGPFAFLDHFDPAYTPNHDDGALRYSYQNQPSVIWWNLVRFGEALGELLAAGARVDHAAFLQDGIAGLARLDVDTAADKTAEPVAADGKDAGGSPVDEAAQRLVDEAEALIMRTGEEYKAVFYAEYNRLFALRLGLEAPAGQADQTDQADQADQAASPPHIDPLLTSLLDLMQSLELDFHLFFRRLSNLRLADLASAQDRQAAADAFFYREGVSASIDEAEARLRIADWLDQWRQRILAQGTSSDDDDDDRIRAMKAVNPNFVPRGWILDEVIRRVEKDGERDVLRRIMHMALHPFDDSWHGQVYDGQVYHGDLEEEARWTRDVPQKDRAMQCSCSS